MPYFSGGISLYVFSLQILIPEVTRVVPKFPWVTHELTGMAPELAKVVYEVSHELTGMTPKLAKVVPEILEFKISKQIFWIG